MSVDENAIQRFLDRLGQALSEGNLQAIAGSWKVPALVLTESEAIAVSDKGQIERFFEQAIAWYRYRGLVSTKAELERLDKLSETLVSVDVRWPALDRAGVEKSSERSHYILQIGDNGQPRIRVALTRSAKPSS